MSIEEEFPVADQSLPTGLLAFGYNQLRARAIQLEKALVRIVEIFDTDGDVYHDIEAMADVAEKTLNQD